MAQQFEVVHRDAIPDVVRRAREEKWTALALVSDRYAGSTRDISQNERAHVFRVNGSLEGLPGELFELDRLESLSLAGHHIGSRGAREIAERLPKLTELKLLSDEVDDDGAIAIAQRLSALRILSLSNNQIGDAGARAVIERLPRLSMLDLTDNNITIVPADVLESRSAYRIRDAFFDTGSAHVSAPPGDATSDTPERLRQSKRGSANAPDGMKAQTSSEAPVTVKPNATEPRESSTPPTGRVVGGRETWERDASEDESTLNADRYAQAIAHLFRRGGDDFCFGLLGHWGRGKTFLMNKVRRELEAEGEYAVVNFSAWAYPQTPTLWAHLYETIAERATRSGARASLPIVIRAGIARHGILTLIGALLVFAVGVASVSLWSQWAKPFAAVLGIGGLTYLSRVARAGRTLAQSPLSYLWSMARHDQPLGLQAVIGRDLEALLVGWRPPPPKAPPTRTPATAAERALRHAFGPLATVCYFGASMLGAAALSPLLSGALSGDAASLGVELPAVPASNPENALSADAAFLGISVLLAITWLAFTAGFWLLAKYAALPGAAGWRARLFPAPPRRVLLVVDDLDRCRPEAMLEVMEGLKQFLESAAVRDRLQVAMLVDESSLAAAILQKYCDRGDAALRDHRTSRQLFIENVEKLFVAYLRLPRLRERDVRDVAKRFFERLRESTADDESKPANSASNAPQSPGGAATPPPPVRASAARPRDEPAERVAGSTPRPSAVEAGSPDEAARKRRARRVRFDRAIHFSPDEERNVTEQLIHATGYAPRPNGAGPDGAARRVGPRTVRSFLFRYQLARLLLARTERETSVEELAEALAAADLSQPPSIPDAQLNRIAQQVSLGNVLSESPEPRRDSDNQDADAPATAPVDNSSTERKYTSSA